MTPPRSNTTTSDFRDSSMPTSLDSSDDVASDGKRHSATETDQLGYCPAAAAERAREANVHRRVALVLVSAAVAFAASVQVLHTVRLRAYRGIDPVCRVKTPRRIVALSFDDGPDPSYTPTVLRLLSTESDHATFFVT